MMLITKFVLSFNTFLELGIPGN